MPKQSLLFIFQAFAGALGDLAAGSQEVSSPRTSSEFHGSPITPVQQRQQRTLPRRQGSLTSRQEDRSPTPSSHRTLRRTSRFSASSSPSPRPPDPAPRRVHLEAATLGITPRPLFSTLGGAARTAPAEQVFQSFRRQLSQELSDDPEEASTVQPSSFNPVPQTPLQTRPKPHPAVRLSKHTRSAILWALEEALRKPHPFTPDPVEENASMADLLGGTSGPATTNGHATSSSRPTAPPAQTGSPQQVIRGPRMIMRERAEREARQRAEREQMERARAEEEARLLEETQRRAAEQRSHVAGAVSGGDIAADPAAQRRQQRAQEAQASSRVPAGMPSASAQHPSATVPPLRPTRVPETAQTPQNFSSSAPQPGVNAPAPAPAAGESSTQGAGAAGGGTTRIKNTFPHAFERWEALSAHWEGMTSFWLRRLQENTDEAGRNPISTQLSRQVADLSAAGANLFHAVVELQRLRASSERKFQRWFFETRAELERHQEVNAMLEAQMEQERQARADAVRKAAQHEAENVKLQKMVAEMRRELLISKEEARRAWEELGRREQEERDRTVSLQQGHPTIVGGVQVVPMTQHIPSRTASRHNRSGSQAADTSDYMAGQTSQYPPAASPSHGAPQSPAPAGDPSARYYQQGEASGQEAGDYGAGSEAGYSEGEYMVDARGNYLRDEHGNKIPFHSPSTSPSRGRRPDAAAEDYESPASQAPTSYPPSSSHWASQHAGVGDYTGQGFAAPGWETMPRHHHPTRLSDVIEEDERSRTSMSHASRA
ncbi:hypothetical protein MYCTH_2142157 [Thermothelomyces thermophilus ATCC 42464]|uniref:Uncharacterized protein n=1 Tax=Thermothelomyces thermophilus (strain ATCC 42464 / BCRC 31852 / DSM 1799) TaxID=573729 RepID=G2Q6F3_THET4|nr:uncharacterized protein MYCTH_2142157 [Thermothelomyces thermophilus ATCC 42464]AEO54725.1 hypothetical protein MYCTH_2142157 [Thermothelomyces thermophilus ATCC 42464]